MEEKIKKGDTIYLEKDEWIVTKVIEGGKKTLFEIARFEGDLDGFGDVLALFPNLKEDPKMIYKVVSEDEICK